MAHAAFVSWVSEPSCKAIDSAMQALNKGWQRYIEQGKIDDKALKHFDKALAGLNKAAAAMEYAQLELCSVILEELQDILNTIKTGRFPDLAFEAIGYSLVRLPTYIRLVATGVPDVTAALFDVLNVVRLVQGKGAHATKEWIKPIQFDEVQVRKGTQDFADIAPRFREFLKGDVLPSLQTLLENDDLFFLLDDMDSQLRGIQLSNVSKRQGLFCWLLEGVVSNAKLNPRKMDLLSVLCLAEACETFFKVMDEPDQAFADTYIKDSFLYLLILVIGYSGDRSESSDTLLERLGVADLFHHKEDVERVRQQLAGSDLSSIEDVYPILFEELKESERALNLSATNGRFKGERLQAACEDIGRIASTLEVVGDETLATELKIRSTALVEAYRAGRSYNELKPLFVDLADAMLFVRRRLDFKIHGAKASIFSDMPMDPSTIQAFLKEARADLRLVRQKLGLHFETGEAHAKLISSVRNLGILSQSLTIIDLGDTANVLRHLALFLYESIEANQAIEGESLRSMATALTAVELHLEYLSRGLIPPDRYIASAKTGLSSLLGEKFSETLPELPAAFLPVETEEKASAADLVPLVAGISDAAEKWDGTRNDTWQGLVNLFSELATTGSLLEYRIVTRLARDVIEVSALVEEVEPWSDDLAELTFEFVNEVTKALGIATSDDPHLPDNCLSDLLVMKDFLQGNLDSGIEVDRPLEIDEQESEPSPVDAQEEVIPGPDVDEELVAIFEKEYSKLSKVLQESWEDFQEVPDAAVPSDRLIHCCHTLKGVSHTIERPEMAVIFGLWEDLCNERQADNLALNETEIALFGETVSGANACVAGLRSGGTLPNAESLTRRLRSVYDGDEPIAEHDVASEMEAELPLTDDAEVPAVQPDPETAGFDGMGSGSPEFGDNVISFEAKSPTVDVTASEGGSETFLHKEDVRAPEPPNIDIDGFEPHRGEYDDEMLALYLEEAASELYKLDDFISDLDANPTDEDLHVDLKRLMHTLKGSSNMAGASTIGFITHELEELLSGLEVGSIKPDELFVRLLSAAMDTLRQLTLKAEQREPLPTPWNLLAAIQHGNENDELTDELVNNALKEALSFGSAKPLRPGVEANPGQVCIGDERGEGALDTDNRESADQTVQTEPTPENVSGGGEEATTIDVAAEPKAQSRNGDESDKRIKKQPASKVKRVAPSFLDIKEGESFSQTIGRLRHLRQEQRSSVAGTGATPPKVKVDTHLLDQLIDSAFEVNVDRDRVVLYQERMERSESVLRKLTDHIESMHASLVSELTQIDSYHRDHPEFLAPDYLDHFSALKVFSRDLEQTTAAIREVQEGIKDQTSHARATTRKLTKTTRSLRENLFNTRLVPIKNMLSALRTVTNKTGEMVGKQVLFEMEGESTQIDRNLLDTLTNNRALEHLIRNSVDHGIESPEERKAAGKVEQGRIVLKALHEGDRIYLKLRDDGAGIDPVKVKAKAVANGLIEPDTDLSSDEVLQLITSSGFSTADSVTQVSGRGVGMDVVRSTIENLGGTLSIKSELGAGTEFVLDLPYTQGVSRALVVGVGESRFAIPTTSIESFGYVSKDDLQGTSLLFEERSYEWMNLSELCGLETDRVNFAPGQKVGVIVVKEAARPFAIACDLIYGMQALHLKSVPFFNDSLKGVLGLAETIDGTLLTVLDPRELRVTMIAKSADRFATRPGLKRQPPARSKPLAIVADDSVALRKSATRFLERIGYQVMQATNGREALSLMDSCYPAILVTDLEMPQMNGFELTRSVRDHENVNGLPVVMVTSRSTEDIEKEAFESGVNCFLPKPFNAEMLADAVDKATSMEVRAV